MSGVAYEFPNGGPETDIGSYSGVWVFAEHRARKVQSFVYELLGAGRGIADTLGEKLTAILLGHGVEPEIASLKAHSPDSILFGEHELLSEFTADAYAKVLADLIARRRPSSVLFGASLNGRDLASTVAIRLWKYGVKAGLAADCTGLEVNDRRQLVQIRPDFGGKSLSAILTPRTRPQMVTVRPGVMKKSDPDPTWEAPVEKLPVTLAETDIRTKITAVQLTDENPQERIEDASMLVSAGLGLTSKQNLKLVEELANALGAGVAGSLAIVERGWLPPTVQVGQSGKTVSPKLYVAVGISGAIQHLVGMDQSEYIVAINNDPEAPIFKIADLGVVGDLFEVLPKLTQEIWRRRKGS